MEEILSLSIRQFILAVSAKFKVEEKELLKLLLYKEDAFFGESNCSALKQDGSKCINKAYYHQNNMIRCGVHSKKELRVKLPVNPDKDKNREVLLIERQKLVEQQALANREAKCNGKIILSKLRMMKEPLHIDGYLKVFPNFKHQNRVDGFGCKSLSPKDIGPIEHKQPGLPIALNLENLHQSGKLFPDELGPDGNPLPSFYETQKKMYLDPIPHRHKQQALVIKGNKNVPVYSVWILEDGKEIHLSYFDSRQIYCKYYERLTKNNVDLLALKKMLSDGYNLQIIGYDAYEVTVSKTLDDCYKDVSRPFGHELVLYSLLTESDPTKYPWNKYGTLNI